MCSVYNPSTLFFLGLGWKDSSPRTDKNSSRQDLYKMTLGEKKSFLHSLYFKTGYCHLLFRMPSHHFYFSKSHYFLTSQIGTLGRNYFFYHPFFLCGINWSVVNFIPFYNDFQVGKGSYIFMGPEKKCTMKHIAEMWISMKMLQKL